MVVRHCRLSRARISALHGMVSSAQPASVTRTSHAAGRRKQRRRCPTSVGIRSLIRFFTGVRTRFKSGTAKTAASRRKPASKYCWTSGVMASVSFIIGRNCVGKRRKGEATALPLCAYLLFFLPMDMIFSFHWRSSDILCPLSRGSSGISSPATDADTDPSTSVYPF